MREGYLEGRGRPVISGPELPSQVKEAPFMGLECAGLRRLSRRGSWVQIPPPAPFLSTNRSGMDDLQGARFWKTFNFTHTPSRHNPLYWRNSRRLTSSGNPPPENAPTTRLQNTRLGPLRPTPWLRAAGRTRKRGMETPQMVRRHPLRNPDKRNRLQIHQPSPFKNHKPERSRHAAG